VTKSIYSLEERTLAAIVLNIDPTDSLDYISIYLAVIAQKGLD